MDLSPASAHSLAWPPTRDYDTVRHAGHAHPWPYALLAIDGAWRHGCIAGWTQVRSGAVIIHTEWTGDDRRHYADAWVYDPDCVIPGERDIWGSRPPR